MPRSARAAALVFLLLPAACAEPILPTPTGEPFLPPASYEAWWSATEACSGRTGRFSRINWVRVPAEATGLFTWNGKPVAGLWRSPHTIYLSDSLLAHEALVRHEMLHDLLQEGGHPEVPFVTPCQVRWPVVVPITPP